MDKRPIYDRLALQRQQQPRFERRQNSSKRGYGRRWEAYTSKFLGKAGGKRIPCIACIDTLRSAYMVDHIIPVNQDPENGFVGAKDVVFWASWNHQPLCREHHTEKSHRHDAWLTGHRNEILQDVEKLLLCDVPHPAIRNWLLTQNNGIWQDGWFDLTPGDDLMQILVP